MPRALALLLAVVLVLLAAPRASLPQPAVAAAPETPTLIDQGADEGDDEPLVAALAAVAGMSLLSASCRPSDRPASRLRHRVLFPTLARAPPRPLLA